MQKSDCAWRNCCCRLESMVATIGNGLQPMLLLAIRLVWGFGFFQAGWGKFHDIDKVLGFFTNLGLPAPLFHVYLVATVETVGGLLILLGLWSRVAAIPLLVTMCVALATAQRDVLLNLFNDPETFFQQAAFLFGFAMLIILCVGPGCLSIDAWRARRCGTATPAGTSCCGGGTPPTPAPQ